MNFPNKLSTTDFEGWVQERNLYNFAAMDAKYVGILETHDAGEAENRGGLVVAELERVSISIAAFRYFGNCRPAFPVLTGCSRT